MGRSKEVKWEGVRRESSKEKEESREVNKHARLLG